MSSSENPADPPRERPESTLLHERIAILEKQREMLELLVRALNAAPLIIWAMEQDGTIQFSEGKGLDLLGLKSSELVGTNGIDGWRGTPIEQALRAALDGKEHHETTEPAPNVFFDNWFIPLRKPDGEQTGVLLQVPSVPSQYWPAPQAALQVLTVGTALQVPETGSQYSVPSVLHAALQVFRSTQVNVAVSQTFDAVASQTGSHAAFLHVGPLLQAERANIDIIATPKANFFIYFRLPGDR